MQEIGIETTQLVDVMNGDATVLLRLGKPRFLKLRKGMELHLREDVWQGDTVVESIPDRVTVVIKQILYFESFEEAFAAVSYQAALPQIETRIEALEQFRRYYSAADEYEYGVMAMTVQLA